VRDRPDETILLPKGMDWNRSASAISLTSWDSTISHPSFNHGVIEIHIWQRTLFRKGKNIMDDSQATSAGNYRPVAMLVGHYPMKRAM
jgi:hypothetical protein